jgi:integrase
MAHSSSRPVSRKPHKDFPLTPRGDGRWCKRIRGKLFYFKGTADEALAEWLRVKDDLLAGRTPRPSGDGFTLRALCNHFLTSKQTLLDSREITARTFEDYHATCERLGKQFGFTRLVDDLGPADFDKLRAEIAKVWGPVRLGNEIQRTRTVFKYGFDAGLMDKPVRFGPTFKRPSKKVLRIERAKKGARMFEAADIRKLLDVASVQFKAMILLGINCGFGNSDVGHLPLSAIDSAGGWINFPRPKTGINRKCKLWQETVAALATAIELRPKAKDKANDGLAFITKYGLSWAKSTRDIPITKELRKLLDEHKLYRPGLGFYALRHTFETIGGETADQVAVDHVMGHARDDMASTYRERISDERLQAVAEHVRQWLFAKPAKGGVT